MIRRLIYVFTSCTGCGPVLCNRPGKATVQPDYHVRVAQGDRRNKSILVMKKKGKKKSKKQKDQLMDALAVVAFVLQAVEFGMEVWNKLQESQKKKQISRIPGRV